MKDIAYHNRAMPRNDHQHDRSHFDFRAALFSILVAIISYISTAMHTLRAQQHRGRVDRVGEQVKAS